MQSKFCTGCNTPKSISDFGIRRSNGHCYRCLECERERHRRHYNMPGVREKRAIVFYARRDRERDKFREYWRTMRRTWSKNRNTPHEKCRERFRAALKSGKIERITICQQCGSTDRIHAHHFDYSKPFDVGVALQCLSRQAPQEVLATPRQVLGRREIVSGYQEYLCKVCEFEWETIDPLAGCPRCRLVDQLEKMGVPPRIHQLESTLRQCVEALNLLSCFEENHDEAGLHQPISPLQSVDYEAAQEALATAKECLGEQ